MIVSPKAIKSPWELPRENGMESLGSFHVHGSYLFLVHVFDRPAAKHIEVTLNRNPRDYRLLSLGNGSFS